MDEMLPLPFTTFVLLPLPLPLVTFAEEDEEDSDYSSKKKKRKATKRDKFGIYKKASPRSSFCVHARALSLRTKRSVPCARRDWL